MLGEAYDVLKETGILLIEDKRLLKALSGQEVVILGKIGLEKLVADVER